ncbi:hypothetical protein SNK04_014157 [Fusarium graminearum]
MTVKVKADGVELLDRVVSGGSITIERPAKTIEVGLKFVPRVSLLRPALQTQVGTSQSSAISVSAITCRFLETTGTTVNGRVAGPKDGPRRPGQTASCHHGRHSD